ncbi:MAG: DUF2764 family protein [Spirochaetota bacterium]
MARYYYLAASLPSLRQDKDPPFTRREFLELCRRHLTKGDFAILEQVDGNHAQAGYTPSHKMLRQWNNFDTAFSRELAQARAERMQRSDRDSYHYSGYCPTYAREAIKRAVSADSPLEAEKMLQQAKSTYLNELALNHQFDLTGIIAYYIKLKMTIRRSLFEFERGEEEFKRLLSNIKTSITSM